MKIPPESHLGVSSGFRDYELETSCSSMLPLYLRMNILDMPFVPSDPDSGSPAEIRERSSMTVPSHDSALIEGQVNALVVPQEVVSIPRKAFGTTP